MRHKLQSFVCIVLFCLFSFPFKLNAGLNSDLPFDNPEIMVSMDFQDVPLKDIMKIFSVQSGLNFIAASGTEDKKITLYLDKVPVKEAMDKLFKANNLTYELDKQAKIFIIKDLVGKPPVETITKIFPLKYATVNTSALKKQMSGAAATGEDATGLNGIIKKLLSEYGSLIEDGRTNSYIITDIPERMPRIAETITALDVSVPQVLIEVEVLDVNKAKVDKMGINFANGGDVTANMFTTVLTGAVISTGFPVPKTYYQNLDVAKTFTSGSLDFSGGLTPYTALINFIKQQTDTRSLARPRILTLNNETAEIKIICQERIGTVETIMGSEDAEVADNAERVETGVNLQVTPQINIESGEVTMYIVPEIKDSVANSTFQDSRDQEQRSTKSIVRVKDGETIIMGGLIRNDRQETITKLPFLGDLPLVGGAFRHKAKSRDSERELLVFITPHIMKESNLTLAQTKITSLPEREQTTVPVIDRENIINTSLNTFDKKKKNK
ncbi:MAG: secretin N-terminal domain-containing protein [Candidatus Omnitrophota bacterium]